MTDDTCSERVYDRVFRGTHNHRCERRATVTRNGKPYCAQHDPERRQRTKNAATRRYEADMSYRHARQALVDAAIAGEPVTDAVEKLKAARAECEAVGIPSWRLW